MDVFADWQQVVVSLIALGAAFVLVRPFVSFGRSRPDGPACPKCAAGEAACTPSPAKRSAPVMPLTPGSDHRH